MDTAILSNGRRNPIATNGVATQAKTLPDLLVIPRHAPAQVEMISIIDGDDAIRAALRKILQDVGYSVECFASCPAFLNGYQAGDSDCLLVDARLPGMSGIELIEHIRQIGDFTPAIVISARATVRMAVHAIKAGAFDVIETPVRFDELLASVRRALDHTQMMAAQSMFQNEAAHNVARLTRRQHEILELVVAGHPSKIIAADLCISQRTVDNHRAAIMKKTGATSIPLLVRTALAAGQ